MLHRKEKLITSNLVMKLNITMTNLRGVTVLLRYSEILKKLVSLVLLKECKDINFIGNVEARDIPKGVCDVVVCEAFVGNVILKLYEGVGATLISKVKAGMMSTLRSKIGALLVKPALKETLKSFDASEYGGAPLLGLKGLVVKAHGSSKANEIKNSLIQCITFSKEDICGKIQENMKQDNKGDN